MGAVQRLIGVFTSPSKTFESIAARPGWDFLIPVILVVAGSFLLQTVSIPKIDVDQAVKDQMRIVEKMSGGEVPAERRTQMEEDVRKGFEDSKRPVIRLRNALILVPFLLIVPGIYRGIAAAFGKKGSYKKLLAGYAYTWTIYLIPILLTVLIVSTRDTVDPNELNFARILKSNVAAFLDFDSTPKPLLGLLSSIDVFDIWAFVVGSISVSKMTEFTRKQAYFVVGSVWGVYTLLKILGGVFLGMMG